MNVYEVKTMKERLEGNTYPGRGIVVGKSADGTKACAAYFIMGRSANSRNRVFTVKNGEVFTEPFDASKIKGGIIHACEKLPVSMQQIDAIVGRIEQAAYNSMDGEISSQRIGDMVMAELKELNEVAYVRFAAVYRNFTDLGSFMEELTHLIAESKAKDAPEQKNE